MRILILSYYFPPFNSIGSVRAGKTAKYLHRFGHDVRVIAADEPSMEQPGDRSLKLELPASCLTYTKWLGVNNLGEWALRRGLRGKVGLSTAGRVASLTMVPRWLRPIAHFVVSVTNVPDPYIGWFPFAQRAAWRLVRSWRPDVIYASGWPFTAFLLAARVARRQGVRWVGEYRDLWAEHEPYSFQPWRRAVDRAIEGRVTASAAGLVTVSQPLADVLRRRLGKPVEVVTNGFDPGDYPADAKPSSDGPLGLVYTGQLYAGKRDLSPLFRAIASMGDDAQHVRVTLCLRGDTGEVRRQIDDLGVGRSVQIMPPVPYGQSLRLQCSADVLLITTWKDAAQKGIFTGKFFEYIGAGRPILAVGPTGEVISDTIRERGLGEALEEPSAIADTLRRWLAQKRSGGVPSLDPAHVQDFSREAQTRRLEAFLRQCVEGGASNRRDSH